MTCIIAMVDPHEPVVHMVADRGVHSYGTLYDSEGLDKMRFDNGLLTGFSGNAIASFMAALDIRRRAHDLSSDDSMKEIYADVRGSGLEALLARGASSSA